jgi:hypothetical protein
VVCDGENVSWPKLLLPKTNFSSKVIRKTCSHFSCFEHKVGLQLDLTLSIDRREIMSNTMKARADDLPTDEERSLSSNLAVGDNDEAHQNNVDDVMMRENLIKREERAVRTARLFVIITIIAMTIGVSVSVYFASVNDKYSFDVAVSAKGGRCQRRIESALCDDSDVPTEFSSTKVSSTTSNR